MDSLSMKEYASFRAMCDKEGVVYDSKEDYEEAARNLYGYAKLVYDLAREQRSWERRLRNEPSGFWLESEGRTCFVCHTGVRGQMWFDKWGLKCPNCHAAFKKKVFPRLHLKGQSQ